MRAFYSIKKFAGFFVLGSLLIAACTPRVDILEAIKEAGIGGVLLFNVSQGIPNGPVKYNSEQHHSLIQHAAR
jgi:hypothetical protein